MNKLLGLLLCGCICVVLGFGATGCGKKDKDKDKTVTKADATTTTTTKADATTTTEKKSDVKADSTTVVKKVVEKKLDDATTEKKVVVETKTASVTLAADALTIETKDKKGSGKAKITATRKDTDEAVSLKFAAPKGVEVKDATIAKGENSTTVDVTVTDAAVAGDQEVTVTGTAGTAVVGSTKLKLKIDAK